MEGGVFQVLDCGGVKNLVWLRGLSLVEEGTV